MRRSRYLFMALTVSALALAAVPALAGIAVTTTRVSVNSAGASGNPCSGCSSNLPISISATGRFVAFFSASPNLVPNDHPSLETDIPIVGPLRFPSQADFWLKQAVWS
jgi:hypothetical protein